MGEHTAFFYGTLIVPGILYRVIYGSRTPEPWQRSLIKVRPAILHGYQRRKVKGVDYPAIIPCPGASVRGSVCTGLTDGDIWRLDIFEGDEYQRTKVKAQILKDEIGITDLVPEDKLDEYVVEEVEVDVYVWKNDVVWLEDHEWDFENFKAKKMKKWTGEEDMPEGEAIDPYFAENENQGNNTGERNGQGTHEAIEKGVLEEL